MQPTDYDIGYMSSAMNYTDLIMTGTDSGCALCRHNAHMTYLPSTAHDGSIHPNFWYAGMTYLPTTAHDEAMIPTSQISDYLTFWLSDMTCLPTTAHDATLFGTFKNPGPYEGWNDELRFNDGEDITYSNYDGGAMLY